MKKFVFMAVVALVMSFSSVTAFAQAGAAGALKIGVIDIGQFEDEKGGITKLLNAARALAIEFQPAQNEINVLRTRLEGLDKELTALREAQEKGNPPIDPKTVKAKEDEFNKLYTEYQTKGQQFNDRLEQRRNAVLGPIYQEIRQALADYAKLKGYSMILNRESIISLGDEKLDVTKDFITYFNTRPAAPTTPATPK